MSQPLESSTQLQQDAERAPDASKLVTPKNSNTRPEYAKDLNHTPVAHRMVAQIRWSTDQYNIEAMRKTTANETRGHYIVSMDPIEFMHEFLPWSDGGKVSYEKFRKQKPSRERIKSLKEMSGRPENEMYKYFEDAFSGWPNAYGMKGRRLELRDTHNCRDRFSGLGPDFTTHGEDLIARNKKQKVDFGNLDSFAELKSLEVMDAFIDVDEQGRSTEGVDCSEKSDDEGEDEDEEAEDEDDDEGDDEYTSDEVKEEDGTSDDAKEPYIAENDESGKHDPDTAENEAEHPTDVDFIAKGPYPFENGNDAGVSTRGQIASCAGVTMAMQFRSHLFSVLICGQYARLIRWDRSAAIVTRRFNYSDHPHTLFEFYHRFAQLTKVQRGLLPNIRKLSRKDANTALKALQIFAGKHFEGQGAEEYEREAKLRFPSMVCMEYNGERYCVESPRFDGAMYSPFGRMTRNRAVVLLAQTAAKSQVVYFKDYWREDSRYSEPEAEVYRLIAEHPKLKTCAYFAKMHAGGDVTAEDGQSVKTIGHEYASRDWARGELRLRRLTAHFIFLTTIGRDLRMFRSAREMVSCMADAMEAHQLAYDELHILHRDISAGNILMSAEQPRHGILIDWDHCIFMKKLKKGRETRVHRTGTWQFMSAHLVAHPKDASHSLLDDRESALHVLMYLCIRYLHHDQSGPLQMKNFLSIFDEYLEMEGNPLIVGTSRKEDAICRGGPNVTFGLSKMNRLIRGLCEHFSARYVKIEPTQEGTQAEEEDDGFADFNPSTVPNNNDLMRNRLAAISQPAWLYTILRKSSRGLPDPGPGKTDFVDNAKLVYYVRPDKRRLDNDACDIRDGSKRIKAHDGMARRITAELEQTSIPETQSSNRSQG